MSEPAVGAVEVAPLLAGGMLRGFVICGRWPDSTREWASFLLLAVRVAGTPGMLTTTTVFGAREELPEAPRPGMVGLVMSEGPVLGEGAVAPGRFADRQPPALLLLHPPSETRPSLPECTGVASGCVPAARSAAPRPRAPGGVGGGRARRRNHRPRQPHRDRALPRPGHRSAGHAAGCS